MRKICLLMILIASFKTLAHENMPVPVPPISEDVSAERTVVMPQPDIKAHLGLGEQDAVFAAPRNYRVRGMDDSSNMDSVEPLAENSEAN